MHEFCTLYIQLTSCLNICCMLGNLHTKVPAIHVDTCTHGTCMHVPVYMYFRYNDIPEVLTILLYSNMHIAVYRVT